MKKNKWRIFLASIKWLWIRVELTNEDEDYEVYGTKYCYTHLFIDYTRTFNYDDKGLAFVIKEFIDDLNDKRTNFYDSRT